MGSELTPSQALRQAFYFWLKPRLDVHIFFACLSFSAAFFSIHRLEKRLALEKRRWRLCDVSGGSKSKKKSCRKRRPTICTSSRSFGNRKLFRGRIYTIHRSCQPILPGGPNMTLSSQAKPTFCKCLNVCAWFDYGILVETHLQHMQTSLHSVHSTWS